MIPYIYMHFYIWYHLVYLRALGIQQNVSFFFHLFPYPLADHFGNSAISGSRVGLKLSEICRKTKSLHSYFCYS